jgi:hypothetical protein
MESLGYAPAWLLVEHEESRAMLAVPMKPRPVGPVRRVVKPPLRRVRRRPIVCRRRVPGT